VKAFRNVNPASLEDAVTILQQAGLEKRRAVLAGGGTDLLGMVKEGLVLPDVVVNLKGVKGLDGIAASARGLRIGGLTTLATMAGNPSLSGGYRVLAEAAASVGTPQIRNAATLAGNVCQRPWCWYLRNGFPCYKNGGDRCFAPTGENQFHAIFGGGPSYIVHPSDTAPALVALDAEFSILGPRGERVVAAREFFTLPRQDPSRETVMGDDEVLKEVTLPPVPASVRSTYRKILDRESWTHAVVSAAVVLEMDGDICRRARVVLGGVAPVPWDLPRVATLLAGQRITPDIAARAAAASVEDARPMSRNEYKIPITRALVRRTLLDLVK
jgi:xanthine dehydrogenase YagS FAD-binding subunit